jgi:predicted RNase H-like nuclease (RuvC/YqgF family)
MANQRAEALADHIAQLQAKLAEKDAEVRRLNARNESMARQLADELITTQRLRSQLAAGVLLKT